MLCFFSLCSIFRTTFHGLHPLSSVFLTTSEILKLSQSARGHFVTLTKVGVHRITCNLARIGEGRPGKEFRLKTTEFNSACPKSTHRQHHLSAIDLATTNSPAVLFFLLLSTFQTSVAVRQCLGALLTVGFSVMR